MPVEINPVLEAASLAWKPADLRPPWQWCEDNYTPPVSSMPGKWRSSNSPWVKQVMEDFADNAVRQITVLCSAQSSKTETMLALLAWIVAEEASPTMWVTSSDEEALKFCNERLMPALRLCPPVAKQIPNDRVLAKSMEILFPTMMLECVGANSKAKLQSRSRRFLLLDEVRNWPDWALPMVMKRSRTWWNSRVVILTTPEKDHDTVHQQFLEGTQNHYHVPCISCGVKAPLDFDQIKAAHPTELAPDGRPKCVKWKEVPGAFVAGKWDLRVLTPQIRYECKSCGHLHPDHPGIRRQMALQGEWVSHNLKAPPHLKSYTWSALLPHWVKWISLVEEFIKAQNALQYGNWEPLKAFRTESLGLPWEDRFKYAKTEGYIDERDSTFELPFAEARRFLSVDVQGKGGRHFYWSIHSFAQGGAQRVLEFDTAWSIEELRSIATQFHIEPTNVLIDTGAFTAEVYTWIMESGVLPDGNWAWKGMKGDKAPHYLINQIRMPFTWTWVDPYLGTQKQGTAPRPIRLLLFSKNMLLDRVEAIMRGAGPRLELSKGHRMLHEYKMQLTAYELIQKEGANQEMKDEWLQKRPDDHWGSCMRQAVVGAYASNLMKIPELTK